jgi:glycosyltransferase involved in cell wall biosynthesis
MAGRQSVRLVCVGSESVRALGGGSGPTAADGSAPRRSRLSGYQPFAVRDHAAGTDSSNKFLDALTAGKIDLREQGVVVIDPFGNGLVPAIQGTDHHGIRNVARCIFESTRIEGTEALEPYDNLLCAPLTADSLMPAVLREMDCALQVSRCEACTNLPAKEAMACGVPVIVANNTGTRDLIDTDNCVALNSQDRVTGPSGVGTEGWGESRVEEIVEALETLYADTQMRKRISARGAAWILEHRRTWRDHAASLKTHLQTLL